MLFLWTEDVNPTPPINPNICPNGTSHKKETIIVSVRDGELDIVNPHIHHSYKGLLSRPHNVSASVNYLLPPRKDVLTTTASFKNLKIIVSLWNALSAVEDAQRSGISRGTAKQVIVDEETNFCVGT